MVSKESGYRVPNYNALKNVIRMLDRLEERATRRMPMNELAKELEVSSRTLERYIQALKDVYLDGRKPPLVVREEFNGRMDVCLRQTRNKVADGVFQYAAVHLAAQHLSAVDDPVLGRSVDVVLSTMVEDWKGKEKLVDRLRKTFVYVPFGPKDYGDDGDTLDVLVQGAVYRRPVDMSYGPPNKTPYSTRVHPYAVVMYRDAIYVLGGEVQAGGRPTRLYAVERIQNAELIKAETFSVPDDVDPSTWFDGRLGVWNAEEVTRVKIAFDAAVAPLAGKRRWPGFVEWTELDDGRSVLELEIPVTPEVVTWVLTWGAQAEVLAPEGLRDQVRTALSMALERYV